MNALFLIPARGGSKGIPGKNIKPLNGKPLLYYSIDVSRSFTHDKNICVSTDDLAIVELAERYGLTVPFVRPSELASDTAGTYEVCLHAVDYYEKRGDVYDILVLMQPTSPFRKIEDVRRALGRYNSSLEMVVSVTEASANPYYNLFEEDSNGFLQKSKKGNYRRRQDCPKTWEYNGAVYVINVQALKQKPLNEFTKVVKIEMDQLSSIDLDSPIDWLWAEFLIERNLIK